MAILNNLVVHGASRFLNTLYANDLTVGGTTTFSTLDVTGAANIAGTLTLSKSQDASGTADNKPALIVGSPTGAHLELDTNEIMAKASATTTAALTINNDGGAVYIAPKGTTYMGNGSKIYATDGTFTAVSYNGTNYTGTNATFDSGKMTNLMVTDTLRSFKWDIDHVANLGGNFLVTPSIIFESGKTAQVTRSGSTLTISITDSGITSLIGGIAWTANSTIKAAGKINNIAIGNCDGTITSINASTNTMIIQVTSGADVSGFATTATSYTIQELTVMLTKVSGTNPIGIYMTASDPNAWPATDSKGKASISIYGGTAPGTGMTATTPVARLGYLGGLPAINGVTPSGWGLYTNHGYFSGLIVSNEGKIGNFTISNALYSSTHSAYNTNVDGVYLGSDYISVGKQGAAYLKADGTGKIGRYTFASNGEFTTTVSNNTAGMGNATYAFWAGATSANAANAPFSVTYAGAIKSTSGTIGGFQIDASSIRTANVAVTSNAKNSISLSSADFKRTIEGVERSGLRFAIGSKFGVDNNGTLYANGVNITNIDASNIKTGKLSADVIDAGSIDVSKLSVGAQTSLSNAAKTATSFITYVSASDGIKVHNADDLTDYVQVNSNAISFFRNNSERTKIEDAAVRVGGIGSNIRNVYITNSAVQIRNNTSVLAEYGSTISLYRPGTTTKAVEITSTGVNVANGVLSGSKLETGEANRLNVEINHGIPSEAVDDTAKVKLSVEPGNIRAITSNTAYARIRHAKFYGTGWYGQDINEYGWYMTPIVYCKQLIMDSGEAIGSNDFEHGLYNMRNDIMDSINESTSKLVTNNVISGINFVGSRRLGIATLTFVNFKFPANTDPSTTAYRIPYGTHKDYYPNEKLDFVSTYITNHTTNNWGRFYVTTDGYIRPVIKPTSDMAIRGTFVYTFY